MIYTVMATFTAAQRPFRVLELTDDFDKDEGLAAREAEYERVAAAAAAAGACLRDGLRVRAPRRQRRQWMRHVRGSVRHCPAIDI